MPNNFTCPNCSTPDSLEIMSAVELPPDERSDEITIQTIQCAHCNKHGLAIYEESRRGALDEDHWSHTGYWLDTDSKTQLELLLQACKGADAEESRKTLAGYYKNNFAGSSVRVDWGRGFAIENDKL